MYYYFSILHLSSLLLHHQYCYLFILFIYFFHYHYFTHTFLSLFFLFISSVFFLIYSPFRSNCFVGIAFSFSNTLNSLRFSPVPSSFHLISFSVLSSGIFFNNFSPVLNASSLLFNSSSLAVEKLIHKLFQQVVPQ